jgi:catechol 2,3-dioxygenase-like lactoylglutathione lyase family enzyme
MLDHISVGVTDLERSRQFYDAALQPLGLVRTVDFQGRGSDYGAMADYYAAFVYDPDGHRIEAVCHAPEKAMIV